MLNYSQSEQTIKNVAIFYAKKIGNRIAENFFCGQISLKRSDEALEVARAFWQITDLVSKDHLNNVDVLNSVNVEFAMHKLFNKVYGYYEKNGFKEQWALAAKENE